MADLLDWRHGQRSDRAALQQFTCTEREGRREAFGRDWILQHPCPWERRVQSLIRGSLQPPCGRPDTALLGMMGEEIAAVVHFTELDGLSLVQINVIAVALAYRKDSTLRLGGEALEVCLDDVTSRALDAGLSSVRLGADIHQKNRQSRRLFAEFGFAPVRTRPDEYCEWVSDLVIDA